MKLINEYWEFVLRNFFFGETMVIGEILFYVIMNFFFYLMVTRQMESGQSKTPKHSN